MVARRVAGTSRVTRGFGARLRMQMVRLRRWLAKRIDPGPAIPPEGDFFISQALRGAALLRERLGITEALYLTVAGQTLADARAYVLYTALDEVVKAAMYLMRLHDFLQGEPVSPRAGAMDRVLISHLVEEQDARLRRLLEVLLVLILFARTNEQNYYRHFLLLEYLEDLLGANDDQYEFYGSRSRNVDASLALQIESIRELEPKLDLANCWYLDKRNPLPALKHLRPGKIFSSVRARIKAALPQMLYREKLLFRFTYGAGYGITSEGVHYSASREDYRLKEGDEGSRISGLQLLTLAILHRVHNLMGRPSILELTRVFDALDRSDPQRLVHLGTVRDFKVGDFVVAYGDLGEVIGVQATIYGYRSYHVRYLAERPMPTIESDWFPPIYVQRLYTLEQAKAGLVKLVQDGRIPKSVLDGFDSAPSDDLQSALRASIVNAWKLGLRDWVRGRQS